MSFGMQSSSSKSQQSSNEQQASNSVQASNQQNYSIVNTGLDQTEADDIKSYLTKYYGQAQKEALAQTQAGQNIAMAQQALANVPLQSLGTAQYGALDSLSDLLGIPRAALGSAAQGADLKQRAQMELFNAQQAGKQNFMGHNLDKDALLQDLQTKLENLNTDTTKGMSYIGDSRWSTLTPQALLTATGRTDMQGNPISGGKTGPYSQTNMPSIDPNSDWRFQYTHQTNPQFDSSEPVAIYNYNDVPANLRDVRGTPATGFTTGSPMEVKTPDKTTISYSDGYGGYFGTGGYLNPTGGTGVPNTTPQLNPQTGAPLPPGAHVINASDYYATHPQAQPTTGLGSLLGGSFGNLGSVGTGSGTGTGFPGPTTPGNTSAGQVIPGQTAPASYPASGPAQVVVDANGNMIGTPFQPTSGGNPQYIPSPAVPSSSGPGSVFQDYSTPGQLVNLPGLTASAQASVGQAGGGQAKPGAQPALVSTGNSINSNPSGLSVLADNQTVYPADKNFSHLSSSMISKTQDDLARIEDDLSNGNYKDFTPVMLDRLFGKGYDNHFWQPGQMTDDYLSQNFIKGQDAAGNTTYTTKQAGFLGGDQFKDAIATLTPVQDPNQPLGTVGYQVSYRLPDKTWDMTNPAITQQQQLDIIRNTPGYQFGLDQSLAAVNARAAAVGNFRSGMNAQNLIQTGNSYATNAYQNRVSQLSGMLGITNPAMLAQSAQGTAQAQNTTGQYSQLANLLPTILGTQANAYSGIDQAANQVFQRYLTGIGNSAGASASAGSSTSQGTSSSKSSGMSIGL